MDRLYVDRLIVDYGGEVAGGHPHLFVMATWASWALPPARRRLPNSTTKEKHSQCNGATQRRQGRQPLPPKWSRNRARRRVLLLTAVHPCAPRRPGGSGAVDEADPVSRLRRCLLSRWVQGASAGLDLLENDHQARRLHTPELCRHPIEAPRKAQFQAPRLRTRAVSVHTESGSSSARTQSPPTALSTQQRGQHGTMPLAPPPPPRVHPS